MTLGDPNWDFQYTHLKKYSFEKVVKSGNTPFKPPPQHEPKK